MTHLKPITPKDDKRQQKGNIKDYARVNNTKYIIHKPNYSKCLK